MTLRPFFTALVLAAAFPAAASAARPLTSEERAGLACAGAFAMVAAGQARGEPGMAQYPALAQRGREYFVRLAAQLMDDAGLDQAGIRAEAQAEAARVRRSGIAAIMPGCLTMLDRDLPSAR